MKFHDLRFIPESGDAVDLHLVASDLLDSWIAGQPDNWRAWLKASGFRARAGSVALIPDAKGGIAAAVIGHGSAKDRLRQRFTLAGGFSKLPSGSYRLRHTLDDDTLEIEALGVLLGQYRFTRYRDRGNDKTGTGPQLVSPDGVDTARVEAIATGEALTRDLINTPANDMGPDEIEASFRALGAAFGADVSVTTGTALLEQNFPLIHAVGRASDRAPRLLDMRWGQSGPRLTLVGKGVCFDTGGLNLKPGGSMGLMKKDMGGAANVMGLALMIMRQGWPVQLRVLVPAVENAVSANAMRPGDILRSRKGFSVEINNTDAEGRLVLADALALADEESPDALICMATLTGAARVALGPDIAPFFTDDDVLATALTDASARAQDPLWRMPLYRGYDSMIEPGIADLDNAPSGGQAGAITAALFLDRFVEQTQRFVHFDIYGHQPKPAPARPKGGAGAGTRALLAALPAVLGL